MEISFAVRTVFSLERLYKADGDYSGIQCSCFGCFIYSNNDRSIRPEDSSLCEVITGFVFFVFSLIDDGNGTTMMLMLTVFWSGLILASVLTAGLSQPETRILSSCIIIYMFFIVKAVLVRWILSKQVRILQSNL